MHVVENYYVNTSSCILARSIDQNKAQLTHYSMENRGLIAVGVSSYVE